MMPPSATALFAAATAWPWRHLPASACVDLLSLAAVPRPAMRTSAVVASAAQSSWCAAVNRAGWWLMSDADFHVIAHTRREAAEILAIDASPGNHTEALGRALGYPACCSLAAAQWGDDLLDAYAAQQQRSLAGTVLDTASYTAGQALVSHIPCSATCTPSLAMARAAQRLLAAVTCEPWSDCNWLRPVS